MSSVLRIALTGGIGSGKSTVSAMFQKHGVPIIDTDIIAREIVKPETVCLDSIITEFGIDILNNDNTLNRDKLRHIIFSDELAKKILEDILHPVIYKEIENQISNIDYPYCIIVIPLLIETNAMERFDRILVIKTSKILQIERVTNRDDASTQIIEKMINSQTSDNLRLKYADDVIDNDVKIEELNNKVHKLHNKFLKLSGH